MSMKGPRGREGSRLWVGGEDSVLLRKGFKEEVD